MLHVSLGLNIPLQNISPYCEISWFCVWGFFPQCNSAGATETGQLPCALPNLNPTPLFQAVTLGWGRFFPDCCREIPCQSFILFPWVRLREDAFKTVGVFPKKLSSMRCPAASWREEYGEDCLRTEWQLNSGKIKLLKGNSRKTYLRFEVLVWLSNVTESTTLSRTKANSCISSVTYQITFDWCLCAFLSCQCWLSSVTIPSG